MTSEKYIEEIYHEIHYSGVFTEFCEKVNNELKLTNKPLYEIVFEIYNEFKDMGLITQTIS